jgi:hypothetical protein
MLVLAILMLSVQVFSDVLENIDVDKAFEDNLAYKNGGGKGQKGSTGGRPNPPEERSRGGGAGPQKEKEGGKPRSGKGKEGSSTQGKPGRKKGGAAGKGTSGKRAGGGGAAGGGTPAGGGTAGGGAAGGGAAGGGTAAGGTTGSEAGGGADEGTAGTSDSAGEAAGGASGAEPGSSTTPAAASDAAGDTSSMMSSSSSSAAWASTGLGSSQLTGGFKANLAKEKEVAPVIIITQDTPDSSAGKAILEDEQAQKKIIGVLNDIASSSDGSGKLPAQNPNTVSKKEEKAGDSKSSSSGSSDLSGFRGDRASSMDVIHASNLSYENDKSSGKKHDGSRILNKNGSEGKPYWTTIVVDNALKKVKVNVKVMTVVESIDKETLGHLRDEEADAAGGFKFWKESERKPEPGRDHKEKEENGVAKSASAPPSKAASAEKALATVSASISNAIKSLEASISSARKSESASIERLSKSVETSVSSAKKPESAKAESKPKSVSKATTTSSVSAEQKSKASPVILISTVSASVAPSVSGSSKAESTTSVAKNGKEAKKDGKSVSPKIPTSTISSTQEKSGKGKRIGDKKEEPKRGNGEPEINELFYVLKNMPEKGATKAESKVFVEGNFSAPEEKRLKDKKFKFSGYIQ